MSHFSGVFEYPRVLVFSPVFSSSYRSSSTCFTYIRIFALFVCALSSVDEIAEVLFVNCVFDVEPCGELRSRLNNSACYVTRQVSLQRLLEALDKILTCFTSVWNFHH